MRMRAGEPGTADLEVFLNGELVKHCFLADTDRGEVRVYVPDDIGRLLQGTDAHLVTEIHHGTVEIRPKQGVIRFASASHEHWAPPAGLIAPHATHEHWMNGLVGQVGKRMQDQINDALDFAVLQGSVSGMGTVTHKFPAVPAQLTPADQLCDLCGAPGQHAVEEVPPQQQVGGINFVTLPLRVVYCDYHYEHRDCWLVEWRLGDAKPHFTQVRAPYQ